MNENDDLYRREEDRKWREKVDHEQVTLMTAVNVLQEQHRELRKILRDLDVMLRGEKGRGGMVAEYEKHDDKLTKLYAVIFQDPTGQKGLLHDVDYLMGRKIRSEKSFESRLNFALGVVVATVGAMATIIAALLAIEPVRATIGDYLASHYGVHITQSVKASPKRATKRRPRPKVSPPAAEPDENAANP